ncbi:MAG: hypothetical protein MI864_24605 [Pseudomonadales bacterium]|nr:hypothetical protein [Pseudomonadales bacterium]
MSPRIFTLLFTMVLVFGGIGGCSSGGDGLEDAANSENSFPPGDNDPLDTGDDDGQQSAELDEVVVTVEATDKMVASWQRSLYRLLSPSPAYAFRGLSPVSVVDLDVVQLDTSLNPVVNPSVSIAHTYRANNDGTYTIAFNAGIYRPTQIDIFIRARLENGETLWAPLTSGTARINVASTLLVESFLNRARANNIGLSSLAPCGDSMGCENQFEARYLIWLNLVSMIQEFDITIPDDLNIEATKAFLSERIDFANALDDGLAAVVDTQYHDAISKEPNFDNLLNPFEFGLNTICFDMGLSQFDPDSEVNNGSVIFNASSTSVEQILNDGSTEYTYPALSEASFTTILNIHSLFGELPYQRRSITTAGDLTVEFNSPLGFDVNSFGSKSTSSFTAVNGSISFPQLPFQTITARETETPIGWLTNPFFLHYYGDDDRNFMYSAPLTTGSVYELEKQGSSTFQRLRQLEATNNFSYLINLKTDEENTFNLGEASKNKQYGTIKFSQQLSNSNPTTVEAHTSLWTIDNGFVTDEQPASVFGDFYSGWQISRNPDKSVTPLAQIPAQTLQHEMTPEETINYDVDLKVQVRLQAGRVSLASDSGLTGEGAMNLNGDSFALTITGPDSRRGIIHGIKLDNETFSLSNATFKLQGHAFYMYDDKNDITSFNGSELSFSSDGIATLNLERTYVEQVIDNNSVTQLKLKQPISPSPTAVVLDDNNKFQLNFGTINGAPLTLQGFVGEDGTVLMMLLRHGDALGLVYGFRDRVLPRS